jgi:hypothetical protein
MQADSLFSRCLRGLAVVEVHIVLSFGPARACIRAAVCNQRGKTGCRSARGAGRPFTTGNIASQLANPLATIFAILIEAEVGGTVGIYLAIFGMVRVRVIWQMCAARKSTATESCRRPATTTGCSLRPLGSHGRADRKRGRARMRSARVLLAKRPHRLLH